MKHPKTIKEINDNPEEYYPNIFDFPPRNFKNAKEVTNDIRRVYMNNEDLSEKTSTEFGKLFSDGIIHPVARLANLARNHGEIYVYEFDYRGVFTEATRNVGYEVDFGVVHADDLQYLFSTNVAPRYTPEDKEHNIVDLMTSIYVNFAKNGYGFYEFKK